MAWQMLVIVAQLGVGAGLVMGGLRKALHYFVARSHQGHAERLARATGRPVGASPRPILIGLAMAIVGVAMLAGIEVTAGMLPPRQLAGGKRGEHRLAPPPIHAGLWRPMKSSTTRLKISGRSQ